MLRQRVVVCALFGAAALLSLALLLVGGPASTTSASARPAPGSLADDPLPPIPPLIHQTYKTSTLDEWRRESGTNNRTAWFLSWEVANPTYIHRVLDDMMSMEFMRREFPGPVFDAYVKMPLAVLRADMLRYALVYKLGGVYSDSDTFCHQAVDKWTGKYSDTTFIASVEWYKNTHPVKQAMYAKTQLVQWTFAAAPLHPALIDTINAIAVKVTESPVDFLMNTKNVESIGGPQVFTYHVEMYLKKHGESLHSVVGLDKDDTAGKRVFFPKSRILLLPMFSFMAQLDPVPQRETRFVSHHFAGTYLVDGWKTGGGKLKR
ncbi:membrane-bound alpha-1,6- mannosyltransferase Initiation-specific [Entophlyctis luteolus]|nr:membrane-bound alpha-1,6- mannosyltransferase Initiation-specific [Entophlyctis luteolus]